MTLEATTPSLDPAARKAVLRMVTYGLYAVGVAHGEDRNMFTANWFTQVSFDPPLVALSVENSGHSLDVMRRSGVFAVSILSTAQREEAGHLGKRWRNRPDKIESVEYVLGVTGCPILKQAPGAMECRIRDMLPAGDSTLVLAEVIAAVVEGDDVPLTMKEAGFRHAG